MIDLEDDDRFVYYVILVDDAIHPSFCEDHSCDDCDGGIRDYNVAYEMEKLRVFAGEYSFMIDEAIAIHADPEYCGCLVSKTLSL